MEVNDVVDAPCNSCGQATRHLVVAVRRHRNWTDAAVELEEQEPDWFEEHALLECGGCQTISTRVDFFYEDAFLSTEYYPPRVSRRAPKWLDKLPHSLSALLDEIYVSLAANSRRLALMGARATLDIVMSDKVGASGSFQQRLEKLTQRGFIGTKNANLLAAALDAGHAATHRAYSPSPETLDEIMDILENLIQAIYVLPAAMREIRKHTPRRPSPRRRPSVK